MSTQAHIIARLVTPDGLPLPEGTVVRVWDQEFFTDDELGVDKVGADGRLELIFDMAAMRSFESPLETEPDVYFIVESGPFKGFRSKTYHDLEVLYQHPITGLTYTTKDMGEVTVHGDEQEYFSINGRVSTPDESDSARFRVAVVSDDWLRDDLIGVGLTDEHGAFRLSFTRDEFNQDWGIEKDLPNLYIVLSAQFNGELKAIQRYDFPNLTFKSGHEDLGELTIDRWRNGIPLIDEDLDPTPGWSKRVERLEVDVDLVKDCLIEVTPLVEQLTGWRHLLDDLNIVVVDNAGDYLIKDFAELLNVEEDSFGAKVMKVALQHCAAFLGLYDPIRHTLIINEDMMEHHNMDALKVVIGHELVHVGQFKNHPELIEEHKLRFAELKSLFERETLSIEEFKEKFESFGFQSQMKELEGYAYYIQRDFLEAHYNLSTFFEHSSLIERLMKSFIQSLLGQDEIAGMTQIKVDQYVEGAELYRGRGGDEPVRFR